MYDENSNMDCSSSISHDSDCIALQNLPQHIKIHLETKLLYACNSTSCRPFDQQTLRIVKVTALPSAQHEVYLVQLSPMNSESEKILYTSSSITLQSNKNHPGSTNVTDEFTIDNRMNDFVQDALRNGNYHVIVRIWIGTSRWWNCHHSAMAPGATPEPLQSLNYISQREVYGYQLVEHIFSTSMNPSKLRLPRVLYYSNVTDTLCSPWAILEYVGPLSSMYLNNSNPGGPSVILDTTFVDSMIPIRMEYGFNETHLRWGRLPLDRCIEYATHVLDSFIVPLHFYFFRRMYNSLHLEPFVNFFVPPNMKDISLSYGTMMHLYKAKYDDFIESNVRILCSPPAAPQINRSQPTHFMPFLSEASLKLKEAIDALIYEAETNQPIPSLPPVLCHMDLQPQNLFFASSKPPTASSFSAAHVDHEKVSVVIGSGVERCPPEANRHLLHLVTVLDWEEAAYADPRFEILMLCRKVCANREQADVLWRVYSQRMELCSKDDRNHLPIELGRIEPWLKLEAVHSLTTLVLECVAGGGRGKRTVNDVRPVPFLEVLGKMQREFQRLFKMGWSFCDTSQWDV